MTGNSCAGSTLFHTTLRHSLTAASSFESKLRQVSGIFCRAQISYHHSRHGTGTFPRWADAGRIKVCSCGIEDMPARLSRKCKVMQCYKLMETAAWALQRTSLLVSLIQAAQTGLAFGLACKNDMETVDRQALCQIRVRGWICLASGETGNVRHGLFAVFAPI